MKKHSEISRELIEKMDVIAENIFKTDCHPDQMPISDESGRKLEKLTPYYLHYRCDDLGEPISWIIVMSSQKETALRFFNKEINEKEFLDLSFPEEVYSAFYLCSLITVPEHQRKGILTELIKEVLEYIPLTKDALFLSWPTTDLGKKAVEGPQKKLGKEILIRK